MLYTNTDSFFLNYFVEDLANKINWRRYLRDASDFSEIKMVNFLIADVEMLIYTQEKCTNLTET